MSCSRSTARALIIGGSVGGLTAAIALSRASQEVILFEAREEIVPKVTGGCRLPPNVTKILYKWGLEERLRSFALASSAIDIRLMTTGERLGRHTWNEELITDAQGDFVSVDYGDFMHFLYDIAGESGANLRYGHKVTSVDLQRTTVTLENGEVVQGDVIIGADGEDGLTRTLFKPEGETEAIMNVYNMTVPEEKVLSDPTTAVLYDGSQMGLSCAWFGNGTAALGWPLKNGHYALVAYGPPEAETTGCKTEDEHQFMPPVLDQIDVILRKLIGWACEPRKVTVNRTAPLEDWWHPDGPLVLVGQAAQPIAPGSVQEVAIPFEDAVTLGRLFSYLRTKEQIPELLEAYEELRYSRGIDAYESELDNLQFMTLPPHEAERRDQIMRARHNAGLDLFSPVVLTEADLEGAAGREQWQKIVSLFGYNAESVADDWYAKQGIVADVFKGLSPLSPLEVPTLCITVSRDTKKSWSYY